MTTLTRCYKISLITVFIYQMEYVSCSYRSGFITLKSYKTSEGLDEVEEPGVNSKRILTNVPFENPYRMRFKPRNPLPRFGWHKFPQQQQEEAPVTMEILTTSATVSTEAPEETTEPAAMEEPTEASMPTPAPSETATLAPETKLPDPTSPTMTTTTMKSIAASSTVSTLPKPFTTFTTIMRPSSFFPLNWIEKIKNLFVHSSPSQINLIQKHGAIKTQGPTKSKGFLSLFEVMEFANKKCSVSMGHIRSMEGVCYHDVECKSLGGISTESCGDGLGVCCIFLTSCGDTVGQTVSYFESPDYPKPVREIMLCILVVDLRKNVQQLRLDFLMFELNRPTDGNCEEDQFIVSGHNVNFEVPVLCGINTGQHIYVHVGNSLESKIFLSFFTKVSAGVRSFNIKITQLEENLAPDGCLQFYNDLQGVVKSFNYDTDGIVVDNKEATYLNNLNYVICLARHKNYCTVTYIMEQLASGSDQLEFQIINKDEDKNDLVPDGQAGAGIFNCPDDFLAINQVRLCGERFNDGTENEDFTMHAPVIDVAAGPIILPFRSDKEYVGRGFRLAYKQDLCL